MAKIDEARLQRIIATVKTSPPPTARPRILRPPLSKQRRAAAKMLEAALTKAGLDVAELNKLQDQDQREAREFLTSRLSKSAERSAAADAAHHQSVEEHLKVTALLTSDAVPPYITINEPFYIAQQSYPPSSILQSGNIAPSQSYFKVMLDTNNNLPNNTIFNPPANYATFSFYYLWENTSGNEFLVNALSNLILTGSSYVEAWRGYLWGLFGGDAANLNLWAQLLTFRYSGWGTDQATGQSNDNTFYPVAAPSETILDLSVPDSGTYALATTFENALYQLTQGPIVVPAGAVALFYVSLHIEYAFGDGGNIADLVKLDLNSGLNGVYCPGLYLVELRRPHPIRH